MKPAQPPETPARPGGDLASAARGAARWLRVMAAIHAVWAALVGLGIATLLRDGAELGGLREHAFALLGITGGFLLVVAYWLFATAFRLRRSVATGDGVRLTHAFVTLRRHFIRSVAVQALAPCSVATGGDVR